VVSKVAWYQTFQSLNAGCVLCAAGNQRLAVQSWRWSKDLLHKLLDWRWEKPTTVMIDFEAECLNRVWNKLVK